MSSLTVGAIIRSGYRSSLMCQLWQSERSLIALSYLVSSGLGSIASGHNNVSCRVAIILMDLLF